MSDLRTVIDQMGREVIFSFPPKRVISLVPSQTEFLIDCGIEVVGRTKFCVHPKPIVDEKPIVGGTKNFRFEKIKELSPDLIIGNKEENYQEGIEALEKEFPVWMSDISSLKDGFQMMSELGSICGKEELAERIIRECKTAVDAVSHKRSGKVLYFIWKEPWMAAGKGTFIDQMLHHLGFENAISDPRYPKLTDQQIAAINPDYILFSSEPFPFKQKHAEEAMNKWPNSHCELVDGELFSWYGSRLKMWIPN